MIIKNNTLQDKPLDKIQETKSSSKASIKMGLPKHTGLRDEIIEKRMIEKSNKKEDAFEDPKKEIPEFVKVLNELGVTLDNLSNTVTQLNSIEQENKSENVLAEIKDRNANLNISFSGKSSGIESELAENNASAQIFVESNLTNSKFSEFNISIPENGAGAGHEEVMAVTNQIKEQSLRDDKELKERPEISQKAEKAKDIMNKLSSDEFDEVKKQSNKNYHSGSILDMATGIAKIALPGAEESKNDMMQKLHSNRAKNDPSPFEQKFEQKSKKSFSSK